jgi:AcrR family transcriptional regulator
MLNLMQKLVDAVHILVLLFIQIKQDAASMSPRRYRADRRRADAEETRKRIVEATVALHSEQGVLATSFADIAERADVAIPTVYNHFRTRGDVLAACTSHVGAQAPPFGPEIFEGAADLETRLHALTKAVIARHRHFAPWMRWAIHEGPLVPELAALLENDRPAPQRMIGIALAPRFRDAPPAALIALCEILLDFSAWQKLPDGSSKGAEQVLAGALIVLATHYAGAAKSPSRSRKSPIKRTRP